MQSQLPFMPTDKEHLDISALETWLWDAACIIRGAMDAPKFKDFILPLIFYKRLSDVFDDEFAEYVVQFAELPGAQRLHRHKIRQHNFPGGTGKGGLENIAPAQVAL